MSKEVLDYLIRTQAAYAERLQRLPTPDSFQRAPFYKRRKRLIESLTAAEREHLAAAKSGVGRSEVLAYTLDGRGKLVQRNAGTGMCSGYNVMFLGSDNKTWWYYGGRRQLYVTAVAVLESESFARHRKIKLAPHGRPC